MSIDDNELFERSSAGQREAVEQLLWNYYDQIHTFITYRIPDSIRAVISADDVMQDTLVAAWQGIGSFEFRGAASFVKWLKTIATRKLLDHIKAQQRVKRKDPDAPLARSLASSSSMVGLLDLLAKDDHTPSRSAARHEAEKALGVALAELKPEYREVIQLRDQLGLSMKEVAARMGKSVGAVQMLRDRALKSLNDRMGRASEYLGDS